MVTSDARREQSLEGWDRSQSQLSWREQTGRHLYCMASAQAVLWAMPVGMRGGLQLLADIQLCPCPTEVVVA